MNDQETTLGERQGPWYADVTPYMWLVLFIASLGWVFDVFEGQIFVASMNEAMGGLLPEGTDDGTRRFYNNVILGAFLVGGAIGGVLFGALSDKIGRTKTMILTILVYSGFTCVSSLSQTWWHLAVLRFFVAMGVGGEWAVAASMVAEVIPARARAHCSAIFHASSVLGTYLAILAGVFIVGNEALGENAWRWGFAIGAVPALLTLWIRWKLKEPECWVEAKEREKEDASQGTGHIGELFQGKLLKSTVIGVGLAGIGMATFWGVHIYGKNITRNATQAHYLNIAEVAADATDEEKSAALEEYKGEIKDSEMLGMFITTTGGGIGLLMFGPICTWLGRRKAFIFYHAGGLITGVVVFKFLLEPSMGLLWVILPIFGFMTLGMHAGYAVYFPELYPTRLRGSGTGFCFNVGRILAAPILFISGWMQQSADDGGLGMTLADSAVALSMLYVLGIVLMIWAPETKGQALPE